jgi:small-conductance mechanosensitive channel
MHEIVTWIIIGFSIIMAIDVMASCMQRVHEAGDNSTESFMRENFLSITGLIIGATILVFCSRAWERAAGAIVTSVSIIFYISQNILPRLKRRK